MEDCSPLWAGAIASHLSWLHAVETKAFRIIGISRGKAESLGTSLSPRRQVGCFSIFYRLLSGLSSPALSAISPPPPYFCRVLRKVVRAASLLAVQHLKVHWQSIYPPAEWSLCIICWKKCLHIARRLFWSLWRVFRVYWSKGPKGCVSGF